MKPIKNLTIQQFFILVFSVFATLLLLFGIIIFYNRSQQSKMDRVLTEILIPAKQLVYQHLYLIDQSHKLAKGMFYDTETYDQSELQKLFRTEIPQNAAELRKLVFRLEDHTLLLEALKQLDESWLEYESILNELQTKIQTGSSSDSIQAVLRQEAKTMFNGAFTLKYNLVKTNTQNLVDALILQVEALSQKRNNRFALVTFSMAAFVLIFLALVFFIFRFINLRLIKPLQSLQELISAMARGKMQAVKNSIKESILLADVRQMFAAIEQLAVNLKRKMDFAEQIGKHNYETFYKPESEDDVLGISLLEMRENLKENNIKEQRRIWIVDGLAKFSELLRMENENVNKTADTLLAKLVPFLEANQAYLYLVHDQQNEVKLELISCYAYERKKYLSKTILPGEGLVGQCYLEKEPIILTEVPADYVRITSGIGEATPRFVVVWPLKINDQVYGILEMASFEIFQEYKLEFLQKLSESIASTISAVRVKEHTQKLLHESQMLTEQLRAQEEEMRQNMEELLATQEEMARKQRQIEEKEVFLQSIVNNSLGVVYRCHADAHFTMIFISDKIQDLVGYPASDFLEQRIYLSDLIHPEDKKTIDIELDIALTSGKQFELNYRLRKNDGYYIHVWEVGNHVETEISGKKILQGQIIDITTIKNKVQELEELKSALELQKQEVEKIRQVEKERADNQIKAQQDLMNKFAEKSKAKEEELLAKIADLESKLLTHQTKISNGSNK